ncbi:pyridine nucleotide-disulphide oxidoreductase dimerisation region [Gluconacetobacter diazotrophicus PA1 5]|uniref:Glutathione reductase n=1 Tax=Gluconacetobacter diazotrophicus (strain ATCC 49037 / DSM 5601 / CCUG 37298 / CIP 103539 / LMG 7603 / PAl5) TaxID=272568 RepID=A9HLF3_GLUDA|nr:glutathione-disulfide reductase [Gluconacetobacter diazotrophicus]ACI50230.1 pyridine nucleotide-disulphide oxidoreductase dimerisation region [Gluconacetobacter diazotrophicus PA1 5]TWB08014.1 glutathione reductase (NADPH) [Gluconacetobacter diazotrophicus]CAP56159.1 Glutathione reductase [Gluconacetobacter diazotrophicus PA1 5]
MTYDFDLFVIGAGSGGVRCARIAAGHGARVAVAENRHWGGTCVNLGCVPKKLMVQASEYNDLARDSHGFGWNIAPGHHDWAALIAAKDHEISRLNGIYVSLLEKAGVTLFTGTARFEDAHTLVIGPGALAPDAPVRRVTAERIVIATGSAPDMPSLPGIEHAISSDAAFHLESRPQRVCMVGGGYIGIEFAGIFRGLGSEVDLVYRQDLPLRGFDQDMRHGIHDAIAARGIRQHTGRSPVSIQPVGDAYEVRLDDGSHVIADCVFFATGRSPNVGALGLDHAGVDTVAGGRIVVDGTGETNVEGIYAIGDVTNRLNLTPVAIAEGHSLADRLFGTGHHPRSWSLATTPKAVFFSPPLATVGLTEEEAARDGIVDIYLARFTPMRHTLTGRARKTIMKLVVDQATQKVVGAHMIGDDAPEMMQGLAIAVTAGLTKADFDRTVGIHPTSAEEFVTMRTRTRVTDRQAD